MESSPREPVVAVTLGSDPSWTVDRHVALRIDAVVAQVSRTHRGRDQESVANEIADRLRALGVPSVHRQVQHLAETIAHLPAEPAR